MISMIVAQSSDGVIGKDGKLPWHNKAELSYFKNKTSHEIVVMGRKTWESIGSRPLPLRTNLVLSSQELFEPLAHYETYLMHSVEEVLAFYEQEGEHNLYVIGGKEIYDAFKPYIQNVIVSTVHGQYDGDTYISIKDYVGNAQPYHTFYGEGFTVNYYEVKHV